MRKQIDFEINSRYDREGEPSEIALPFARGEVWPQQAVQGKIKDGKENLPAQFKVTGTWEDGSVRWLLVHFLAFLPANRAHTVWYDLDCSDERQALDNRKRESQAEVRIVCDESGRICAVENGVLKLKFVQGEHEGIFQEVRMGETRYGAEQIQGPILRDANGLEYRIRIDQKGWSAVEKGPVYAMLQSRGKHWSEENHCFLDFRMFLTIWAGKPWIHLDYQLINCEEAEYKATEMELTNRQAGLKYSLDYPFCRVRSIRMEIRPPKTGKNIKHKVLTSGFNYEVHKGGEEDRVCRQVTANTVAEMATEMFPEVLLSIFTGDWDDGDQAVAAGIYQAYQNFPKAITTSRDGIDLWILPETEPYLKLPQGAARTTRLYLYFHPTGMDERLLVDRALQMELPPKPVVQPSLYRETRVFGEVISEDYHHATERFLYRYVDSRAKGLGMMNFGDGPEWEYGKQGRSGGRIVWINNEYDMPHNFMIMLARTGDRRYFDYMKASVEHWYDVDLCHYSSKGYTKGLLYTHSVDHVSGQPVPSHQWVEGFLDYYHQTGNPNGWEAAQLIGEGLLELLELPLYHEPGLVEPREIGWAMRTFMALYRETHEQRWLDACQPIAATYLQWAKEMGSWVSPYPDNFFDRVPFMIHVGVAGLYQYYEYCPEPEIRRTLLLVIDDMLRECYLSRADMFYGKQSPSVRYQNLNGMVLGSLAIAYELTGDAGYIEKGLGMFDWISQENQPPIYDFSKYKVDEYTVICNCPVGPKRCAQTLLPFLHYYRWARELGYLKNREEEERRRL